MLALVSLGSNLGDTTAALDAAEQGLRRIAAPDSYLASERHETRAVGGPPGQGAFLNQVVRFETTHPPEGLLAELQAIEASLDRRRPQRWSARTLDADLLLYGEEVVRGPTLRVPHPRMTYRPFVLAPAVEVAGDWRHPECDATLAELWRVLTTGADVVRLVGGDTSAVREWVASSRGDLPIDDGSKEGSSADARGLPPRLTIVTGDAAASAIESGPRLALADCPPEHWRDEVLAALECVWPREASQPST